MPISRLWRQFWQRIFMETFRWCSCFRNGHLLVFMP